MDVRGKKFTIVGGARSGLAVAKLLMRQGATSAFLTERGAGTEALRAALIEANIAFEFDGHTDLALEADAFILSPGVPTTAPLVQTALAKGLDVYSEVEAASWFCKAPILAITGSNGKTTTTSMLGHMFQTAQRPHVVGGNIGLAFSDYVDQLDATSTAILEVSSFQLDHIDQFRPKVSLLLNITPDHLDRYQYKFENYAQSKYRIFERQTTGDVAVYNADDAQVAPVVEAAAAQNRFKALAFSLKGSVEAGAFVQDQTVVFRVDGVETWLMPVGDIFLRGKHNLYNAMAAALAAFVQGIPAETIAQSLATFKGVEHRLELVRSLDGVKYYNDSKATNVDSVWYALESFHEPIILLAGGRDKGNDYKPLHELTRQKVKVVIGVGAESGQKVVAELGCVAPKALFAETMEAAVNFARAEATEGDVVLLSPACASFDLFKNYEHRGQVFKDLVMQLT